MLTSSMNSYVAHGKLNIGGSDGYRQLSIIIHHGKLNISLARIPSVAMYYYNITRVRAVALYSQSRCFALCHLNIFITAYDIWYASE
jgi:hypothetical protein